MNEAMEVLSAALVGAAIFGFFQLLVDGGWIRRVPIGFYPSWSDWRLRSIALRCGHRLSAVVEPNPSLVSRLIFMGWPGNTSESVWVFYRLLMATTFSLGALVTLVVFDRLGVGLDFVQALGVILLLGVAGWVRPTASLRQSEDRERRAAVRGFPAFLDGLALSVQSGQSFSQAMVAAVSRMPRGTFRRQSSRWVALMSEAVARLQARQPRAEVFQMLCERLPIPVMRQFASAVLTTEQSGGSLSKILRHQAQQARSQLAMEIERQAQEAPVKLLAPLMLCIFPCTFLVLLAPLSVRLMDFLA